MFAEAFTYNRGEGIAPGHCYDPRHGVVFEAAWEALFPACVKDEQQQSAGEGKVDGAGRAALFRVHRAEDMVAQEQIVEDDEGCSRDDGKLPVIEEQQDDPHPHTGPDMYQFARKFRRIVSPTPDGLDKQQHTKGEDI